MHSDPPSVAASLLHFLFDIIIWQLGEVKKKKRERGALCTVVLAQKHCIFRLPAVHFFGFSLLHNL